MKIGSPNHKGLVAEAMIAARAVELGLDVLHPSEHSRYDLAFDLGEPGICRVQCKWAARKGAVIPIKLASSRWTPGGQVVTTYSRREVDAIAAYCPDVERCYLVAIEEVEGRSLVQLRLEPPGNGQRAGLNYAADYELPGAVAQLGERRYGIPKVVGSSPISSIESPTDDERVGAHEFRERFGWYMERAAAGESFTVTRHGTPRVRLVPAASVAGPTQQPDLAA